VKQRLARRRYYEANRDKVIDRARARSKVIRDAAKLWLHDYLKEHPCVDCGETNPIILEFDHVRDKKFNISDAVRKTVLLDQIKVEVDKCEVRCANCHRAKTYRDMGRTHRG